MQKGMNLPTTVRNNFINQSQRIKKNIFYTKGIQRVKDKATRRKGRGFNSGTAGKLMVLKSNFNLFYNVFCKIMKLLLESMPTRNMRLWK